MIYNSMHTHDDAVYILSVAYSVPTRAPTKLKAYSINSTTLLLSWRAPDADEYSHTQQYHVEVTDKNSGQMSHYITENTHLLFNKSRPNHQYAFRVAAYTNRRGPFSQYYSITQHSLTLVTGMNSVYVLDM